MENSEPFGNKYGEFRELCERYNVSVYYDYLTCEYRVYSSNQHYPYYNAMVTFTAETVLDSPIQMLESLLLAALLEYGF